MLLAIDIGNTHTVVGLFKGEELLHGWRLQSNTRRTVDEFALQIHALFSQANVNPDEFVFSIIASVVPELTRVFSKLVLKYFNCDPIIFSPELCKDMEIRVDNPDTVGADRIANAYAARVICGSPAIIVDFGTATTFDVLSPDGAYEGGVIAPGLLISANALFEQTAKLPHIQLVTPKSVVGKNTKDSMLSGIIYGYTSLVDGIIDRIRQSGYREASVVATGGLAHMIAEESRNLDKAVSELTLCGLLEIAILNGYETSSVG